MAGKKAITAASGPGFTLKQENLGFATMIEVPVIVVNVQRVGPSTGLPTAPSQGDVMQTRWGRNGDQATTAPYGNIDSNFDLAKLVEGAEAGDMVDDLNVSQSQSYGPESRGGASRAEVVFDEDQIDFPKVIKPNLLVCLTQEAFNQYGEFKKY